MSHLADEAARKQLQSFSTNDNAQRVVLVGNQFAVELNHKEDSITTLPMSKCVTPNSTVDCSGFSRACLFGEAVVKISPEAEGENFFELSVSQLVPFNICAIRIKIEGNGSLVLGA
jgi:hypothetical protein